jgi:hypothetical protein
MTPAGAYVPWWLLFAAFGSQFQGARAGGGEEETAHWRRSSQAFELPLGIVVSIQAW